RDAIPGPNVKMDSSTRLNTRHALICRLWVRRALARRFLHESGDPCLFGGSQPLQREGGRPHVAFVEVRLVAEAERRVPRLELLRCLEEADDLTLLALPGIRGHPIPESRREGWHAFHDDSMQPLGQGAIRCPHFGGLREHGAFPARLVRSPFLAAFLHPPSLPV